MRPADRHRVILDYLGAHGPVDVLHSDFVTAYAHATGTPVHWHAFGPPTCRALGRDLAQLHRHGKVERSPAGVSGAEAGFPRWVYTYRLPGSP